MTMLSIIKKSYTIYYYASPLPVLSRGEAIAFNLVFAVIAALAMYWIISMLPVTVLHFIERSIFYVTGDASLLLGQEEFLILEDKVKGSFSDGMNSLVTNATNYQEKSNLDLEYSYPRWSLQVKRGAVHPT